MALLISFVGPFGMIGIALFKGKQLGGNLLTVFLAAGLVSFLLLVYVFVRMDVFSIFFGRVYKITYILILNIIFNKVIEI
ncbi:MAG: hypothetical protein N2316_11730 [Spirochaetes bacterium]|nr:hypothetical protein [Spirochaetota bacterium]